MKEPLSERSKLILLAYDEQTTEDKERITDLDKRLEDRMAERSAGRKGMTLGRIGRLEVLYAIGRLMQ